MSRETDTPQELKAVESGLASLAPTTLRLDRDRLMYLAGQAAAAHDAPAGLASRRAWIWPAASAGVGAVSAALLVLLVARPAPRVVERIVYVPATHAAAADAAQQPGADGASLPRHSAAPSPGAVAPRRTFGGGWMGLAAPSRRPEYLSLRDQVLAFGVDVWQKPPASGGAQPNQPTYREALDRLLDDELPSAAPLNSTEPRTSESTESTEPPMVGVQI